MLNWIFCFPSCAQNRKNLIFDLRKGAQKYKNKRFFLWIKTVTASVKKERSSIFLANCKYTSYTQQYFVLLLSLYDQLQKNWKKFFLINQELHICGLGKIFPKLANPKKERHVYSRGNLRCSESLKEAQKCPLWTLASYRRFLGDSRSHSLFGLLYVWPVFRTQPVAEKQACSSIEDNSTLLCLPRSRKRSMRGLILSTELVRDTIKSKKLE